MCFNFAFVPIVYFTFVETNGYKLEEMDAIFAEAHKRGENPVFLEHKVRKGKMTLDVEESDNVLGEKESEKNDEANLTGEPVHLEHVSDSDTTR